MIKKIKSSWKDLVLGENPKFVFWTFPILMATFYFVAPYILTLNNPFGINYTESGQIGDTIGGISNPLISIFAVFLTFLAFWVQFQSNKKQTAQFANQDKFQKIERFENKFYQLLNIHKNNVNEIRLDNKIEGKKVFEELLTELELSYEILRVVDSFQWPNKSILTDSDRIKISYVTFYIGVQNNTDILSSLLSNFPKELILEYKKEINKIITHHIYHGNLTNYESNYAQSYQINHRPFSGHINRLGHYFRHLFHMYNLIDKQAEELEIDKIDFTRIIRTQMSSIEQLHLFYNIQSTFGQNWIKFEFVKKYKVFRNMPLPLARIGVAPKAFLEILQIPYEDFFEWQVYLKISGA